MLAHSEKAEESRGFGMCVPWVVATKSLVGRVQQASGPQCQKGLCCDSPNRILLLCF
jgi:hypothetical protein